MNPVTSILVGLVVGIVSAYVTAMLAFRRFRHEKLWERKHEAYVRLLAAFHTMDLSIRRIQADDGKKTDEDKVLYGNAVDEVVYAVNVGRLLLPADVIEVLEAFRRQRREIAASNDVDQRYPKIRTLNDDSLEKVVNLARRDLGIAQ